jgi:hypothetical protein
LLESISANPHEASILDGIHGILHVHGHYSVLLSKSHRIPLDEFLRITINRSIGFDAFTILLHLARWQKQAA